LLLTAAGGWSHRSMLAAMTGWRGAEKLVGRLRAYRSRMLPGRADGSAAVSGQLRRGVCQGHRGGSGSQQVMPIGSALLLGQPKRPGLPAGRACATQVAEGMLLARRFRNLACCSMPPAALSRSAREQQQLVTKLLGWCSASLNLACCNLVSDTKLQQMVCRALLGRSVAA
jgi:hypothetical protein